MLYGNIELDMPPLFLDYTEVFTADTRVIYKTMKIPNGLSLELKEKFIENNLSGFDVFIGWKGFNPVIVEEI